MVHGGGPGGKGDGAPLNSGPTGLGDIASGLCPCLLSKLPISNRTFFGVRGLGGGSPPGRIFRTIITSISGVSYSTPRHVLRTSRCLLRTYTQDH